MHLLCLALYPHTGAHRGVGTNQSGFHTGFSVRGDNVPVINKSHLGGSGGMLPQKIFEF